MSQIPGKYVLERQEKVAEYLGALGVPAEQVKDLQGKLKCIEIKVEGNEYSIIGELGTRKFPLNKEIDEPMGESTLKSTATVEGNKLSIKSKDSDGRGGERSYEGSATGLTVTLSTEGVEPVGKLFYKRE